MKNNKYIDSFKDVRTYDLCDMLDLVAYNYYNNDFDSERKKALNYWMIEMYHTLKLTSLLFECTTCFIIIVSCGFSKC